MVVWAQMVVSVLAVYPWDWIADWKPWLAVAAQHHKGVSYHILQEKIKILSTVSTECIITFIPP